MPATQNPSVPPPADPVAAFAKWCARNRVILTGPDEKNRFRATQYGPGGQVIETETAETRLGAAAALYRALRTQLMTEGAKLWHISQEIRNSGLSF